MFHIWNRAGTTIVRGISRVTFCETSNPLQRDVCKLSVLLTFHINSLGNFASRESSIDYAVLGI